jgi:hypothetical protein
MLEGQELCQHIHTFKVAPYSYSPVLKHLYSSDVILATRAWNLRGPVKILKHACANSDHVESIFCHVNSFNWI